MDLLATGAARLNTLLASHAGRAVTYRRRSEQVSLTATPAHVAFESINEQGGITVVEGRDYSFAAAALVLSGETVEPAAGDILDDGDERYEVVAPPGRDAWAYKDGPRSRVVVHTRHTGAVP
jgi:hypothetical protein